METKKKIESADTEARELPTEVAETFEMVKAKPGEFFWKGKKFDTRTISKEKAAELVESGFHFMKYKEGKTPKKDIAPVDPKKP